MNLFSISPIGENTSGSKSELVNLFFDIWNEREHVSEVSGTPLPFHFDPSMFFVFSHVRSRGSCPALALCKKNIVLMTKFEHEFWEHNKEEIRRQIEAGNESFFKWKGVLALFDELKSECNKLKKHDH